MQQLSVPHLLNEKQKAVKVAMYAKFSLLIFGYKPGLEILSMFILFPFKKINRPRKSGQGVANQFINDSVPYDKRLPDHKAGI